MKEHMEEEQGVLHFGKGWDGVEARETIARTWNVLSRHWEDFEVILVEGSTILIIIAPFHLVMGITSCLLIRVLGLFAWAAMRLLEDLLNCFAKFGSRGQKEDVVPRSMLEVPT
jgi:hypothetical protein